LLPYVLLLIAKGHPAHKADNLNVTCVPVVGASMSQPYVPSWPVTGVALPFLSFFFVLPAITKQGLVSATGKIFSLTVWQDSH
jgi:hypothetical protein